MSFLQRKLRSASATAGSRSPRSKRRGQHPARQAWTDCLRFAGRFAWERRYQKLHPPGPKGCHRKGGQGQALGKGCRRRTRARARVHAGRRAPKRRFGLTAPTNVRPANGVTHTDPQLGPAWFRRSNLRNDDHITEAAPQQQSECGQCFKTVTSFFCLLQPGEHVGHILAPRGVGRLQLCQPYSHRCMPQSFAGEDPDRRNVWLGFGALPHPPRHNTRAVYHPCARLVALD